MAALLVQFTSQLGKLKPVTNWWIVYRECESQMNCNALSNGTFKCLIRFQWKAAAVAAATDKKENESKTRRPKWNQTQWKCCSNFCATVPLLVPLLPSLSLSHTLPFQSHLHLHLHFHFASVVQLATTLPKLATPAASACLAIFNRFYMDLCLPFSRWSSTHTWIIYVCMYLYLYKLSFIISKLVWCTCAPPSPLFLLLLLLRFNAFFRIALGSSSRGSNRVSRGVTGCARSLKKLSQLN